MTCVPSGIIHAKAKFFRRQDGRRSRLKLLKPLLLCLFPRLRCKSEKKEGNTGLNGERTSLYNNPTTPRAPRSTIPRLNGNRAQKRERRQGIRQAPPPSAALLFTAPPPKLCLAREQSHQLRGVRKKRLENLIYSDISDSQAVLLRGI